MPRKDIRTPEQKARRLEETRLRWARVRREVLTHYSNGFLICACCGETHYEFLALDHINGGGRQERKERGNKMQWRWLQILNYPNGYQVLCHNCNCAKHVYGECPHQAEAHQRMEGQAREA